MPVPTDWRRWELYQRTIEACLREDFAPPNTPGGKGSAVAEAERRLCDLGHLVPHDKMSRLAKWVRAQDRLKRRGLKNCLPNWALYRATAAARIEPTSRVVLRAILTSAQNDTAIHRPFFNNLKALASYYGARLHVGKFTYQVAFVGDRARARGEATRHRERRWDPDLADYLTAEQFGIGNLLFCAEMNTLPTATQPLSGLHTYGRGQTAIFPHAKVQLEAVPSGPDRYPPLVLTTGACTVPSYSDTKAGQKGVFHHILGAVVVEVDDKGRTFFRHVIGKQDGTFQDLDILVKNGNVTTGHRIEAITFGDIQSPFLDPGVAMATWGFDVDLWRSVAGAPNIVDTLRPHYGFFHDLIDFKSISHHDEKSTRERFRTFMEGGHRIEYDLDRAAQFLVAIDRDFMKRVVVKSNHDRWIDKWLDRCDHRADRDNAIPFLRYELARLEAVRDGDNEFDAFRYALTERMPGRLETLGWVPENGSFMVQDIECGWHSDLGPNGSRGNPRGLAKVATKKNCGDKHTTIIIDGDYYAGTASLRQMRHCRGPSKTNHAHVLIYPTGKRCILMVEDGKWRA